MTLKLLHTHSSLFLLALRGAHLILLSSSLFTRTHLCSLLAWYAVPMVWMCFSQMYVFESIKIRVAFIYVNLFAIAIMRGAPPLGSRSTFTIYHQSRPNRTLQIRDDNMPSNNEKRWRTLRFFYENSHKFYSISISMAHCALHLHLMLETLQGFYFNVKWTNSKAYCRFANTQQKKVATTAITPTWIARNI